MSTPDGSIVILTEINTSPFDRGLRDMENSARGFTGNLSSILKRGMAAIGFGLSAKEIANFAGTMTDLESRARIASRGLEDTAMIMGRLRDIADRAYSPLEATATAFMNNSTALNALGMSMKDQLDLTDSLTNALIVAGAKGEQFEMVMNVVNRSLAVGKMGSQELEMIQKYGGTVAEALARQLNTNVIGLKEYAQQGKITAQVISEALVGSMEMFRQQAEDMPATIGDALVRLRNQVMATTHELNQSFGFEQGAVQAIDKVKETLKEMHGPLEDAISLGTNLFVALLGGKAIAASINFTKARIETTRAIIAETQAEKAAAAARGTSAAAEHRYASERVRQAAARRAAAQETVMAARAQAEADLLEMQTARAAMATRVQTLQTRIAETRVFYQNAAARMSAAAQSAVLARMDRELLALTTQLTAAQNGLSVASSKVVAANNALVASSSRAGVAMTGLKAAGSRVLAMFGGPWGLALTAAAAGVYYLATRQSEGEKAAEKYGKEIAKLKEKYGLVRDGANEAADAVEKSMSRMQRDIADGKKSLEIQAKDMSALLKKMLNFEFEEGTRQRGELVGRGLLAGADDIEMAMRKIVQALEDGRRDVYPEVKSLDEMIAKHFGEGIPERLVAFVDMLRDFSLRLEGTADGIAAAEERLKDNMSGAADIDWSPILNRQKTFSEQLVAQLEAMGVRVKGIKLVDVSDSISSLESARKKISEKMEQTISSTEDALARLRATTEAAMRVGPLENYQTLLNEEATLNQKLIALKEDLHGALSALTAKFLSDERIKLEQSLNDKALTAKKEVEIRKKAAEDMVKAMASQGTIAHEALQAIIDVTAASDNLGAAQRDVAQAALYEAQTQAEAALTTAALAGAAAAAEGDLLKLANATAAAATAAAALANLEGFKFELPPIGGGGRRGGGGGGGGVNEQKKSLEEIELILAKLNGDFEKIRQIEANRELEKFIELVKKAGLSSSEAAAKIEEFKQKQGSQLNTDNLQTLIQFYDSLRNVLPQAAAEFEQLNAQLIEQQAQAYLAAGAAAELVEKWKEMQGLMTSADWEAGVKRSAQTFINEWTDAGKVAEKAMNTMITGFQDLASGVLDSLFDGAEFRADKFLKDLGKKLLTLALNQAIASLMKFFGMGVGTAHTGGIVGADVVSPGAPSKTVSPFAFIGAKKYHGGGIVGLGRTEVPAVLQKGEGVFTAAQMKALAPADSMSFRQEIKIVNPPGIPLTATTQSQRGANGAMQTSVLLKSVEDGLANRMKTGESKLAPTIEGRYGLNSARGAHLRTGGS